MVDGTQVQKVGAVSQKAEQVKRCVDLEHCLHWLHAEPIHLDAVAGSTGSAAGQLAGVRIADYPPRSHSRSRFRRMSGTTGYPQLCLVAYEGGGPISRSTYCTSANASLSKGRGSY
jgi:hypothetical protein